MPEHCCLSLNNLGEERCFSLSLFQGGFFFFSFLLSLLCAVLEFLEHCGRAVSVSQEDKTKTQYFAVLKFLLCSNKTVSH